MSLFEPLELPLSAGPFTGLLGVVSLLNLLRSLTDATPGSVYWDHQEPSGAVLGAYNSALALGRNVVINGDFASDTIWTKGANWTIVAGVATHAAGATADLSQDGIAAVGKTWQLTYTISGRTAGSVTAKLGASFTARSTNATFVETITATSADLDFTPTSDFDGNIDDVLLQQTDIPANDSNLDGAHTGVTVGQTATSALGLAVLDDGATSFTNIYSTEVNSLFDPASFTLVLFGKAIDVEVWTDGSVRMLMTSQVDAQNRIQIVKNLTADNINVRYEANNIDKSRDIDTGGPVDDFMIALTVDTGADEGKVYFNGVQVGADLTLLGTWIGNFNPTNVVIGATSTVPGLVWDGFRTHVALLRGVLDDATILQIAQFGGVT